MEMIELRYKQLMFIFYCFKNKPRFNLVLKDINRRYIYDKHELDKFLTTINRKLINHKQDNYQTCCVEGKTLLSLKFSFLIDAPMKSCFVIN